MLAHTDALLHRVEQLRPKDGFRIPAAPKAHVSRAGSAVGTRAAIPPVAYPHLSPPAVAQIERLAGTWPPG